jgi:hypothetical protein
MLCAGKAHSSSWDERVKAAGVRGRGESGANTRDSEEKGLAVLMSRRQPAKADRDAAAGDDEWKREMEVGRWWWWTESWTINSRPLVNHRAGVARREAACLLAGPALPLPFTCRGSHLKTVLTSVRQQLHLDTGIAVMSIATHASFSATLWFTVYSFIPDPPFTCRRPALQAGINISAVCWPVRSPNKTEKSRAPPKTRLRFV